MLTNDFYEVSVLNNKSFVNNMRYHLSTIRLQNKIKTIII